jgi:hypothetical protein
MNKLKTTRYLSLPLRCRRCFRISKLCAFNSIVFRFHVCIFLRCDFSISDATPPPVLEVTRLGRVLERALDSANATFTSFDPMSTAWSTSSRMATCFRRGSTRAQVRSQEHRLVHLVTDGYSFWTWLHPRSKPWKPLRPQRGLQVICRWSTSRHRIWRTCRRSSSRRRRAAFCSCCRHQPSLGSQLIGKLSDRVRTRRIALLLHCVLVYSPVSWDLGTEVVVIWMPAPCVRPQSPFHTEDIIFIRFCSYVSSNWWVVRIHDMYKLTVNYLF